MELGSCHHRAVLMSLHWYWRHDANMWHEKFTDAWNVSAATKNLTCNFFVVLSIFPQGWTQMSISLSLKMCSAKLFGCWYFALSPTKKKTKNIVNNFSLKKLWIYFLERNSDFQCNQIGYDPTFTALYRTFFQAKKASIFDFLPFTGKSPHNSPLEKRFTHPSASYASFIILNGKSKRSQPFKIFLGTVDFLGYTLSILAHSAADMAVIFASLHLKKGWQE